MSLERGEMTSNQESNIDNIVDGLMKDIMSSDPERLDKTVSDLMRLEQRNADKAEEVYANLQDRLQHLGIVPENLEIKKLIDDLLMFIAERQERLSGVEESISKAA